MRDDRMVLWNGVLVAASEVRISPWDRGLLLGDGAFETLRADEGLVHRIHAHAARLARTLAALRIAAPDTLADAPARFADLLAANALDMGCARLRWTVTRGAITGGGLPAGTAPTELVTAERYAAPGDDAYAQGWSVLVSDHMLAPSVAAHKSLSYLPCLLARQDALDRGHDECLLRAPDGSIAEGSASGILLFRDGEALVPDTPQQLAGITRSAVCALLEADGIAVHARALHEADLLAADAVWCTNALVGVMPVRTIGSPRSAGLAPLPHLRRRHAASVRARLFAPHT